jgi:hypothetical protein
MNLKQWLDQWAYKSADVQARVKTALEFLKKHYGEDNEKKILSEIRCIDFSHAVSLPSIPSGTILVGSKDPRVSPYRSTYFTRSGHPISRLGVATQGTISHRGQLLNPKVLDKVLYRYEVVVTIPSGEVLQSVCAPARDNWSIHSQSLLVGGGGLQYLIPQMNRYLRYLE